MFQKTVITLYYGAPLLGVIASVSVAHADVVVSSKATANMNCGDGSCEPTADKAVLNATDLANFLSAYGNVRVMTTSQGVEATNNISNDQGLKGLSSHKLRSGLPRGFSKKVWTERGNTNRGFPYLTDNPPPK